MNPQAKEALKSFKRERKAAERARQASRAAARAAKRAVCDASAWAEALRGVRKL